MRYSLFLPLLAILLPGCKPQEPVYATDKDLGGEGQPLMPTGMYFVYGEELTKGRVGEPDLSHLTPPEPEEEPDDDDSGTQPHPEIQSLIDRHNEFLRAGEYDKAAELYKEEFRPLAAADFGLITKTMQIVEAMGADSPVAAMLKPMLQASLTANLVSTEPEADGIIVGTIQTAVPGAPPKRFVFERIDDEWLFVGEEGTTSDNVDQLLALSDEVGSQLDTILAGMEDGSIDGQSAIAQLQQAGMSAQAKAEQIRQASISDLPQEDEPEDEDGEAAADGDGEAAPELSSAPAAANPVNLDFEAGDGASGVPSGWIGVGDGYEKSTDADIVHGGSGSGRIKHVGPGEPSFATLAQPLPVDKYKGKRVRLSGYLRTEGVSVHAGLGMFAEGSAGQALANDSMRNHSVTGTTEWKSYEIVLDIPEKIRTLSFGAMLSGTGSLWIDDLEIQIVEE